MTGPAGDLVGRSHEVGRLSGLLTGELHALVIAGDAGVGKTALVDDLGRRARNRGWSVSRYQCVEAEQDFPYSTLDQVLRPLMAYAGALPDHQRSAVDIVLGRAVGEAPATMALGTAVLALLVHASADCPRAVLVDDAHWMDSASGQVLMFAARRLSGAPACIALALRTGEPTDLDVAGIEHLELRPLDPASAAELIDARHPGLSPALRAEALRWAVGNPLALTELPASLAARSTAPSRVDVPLPRRLEQVYAQRLARLPEEEQFALLLLALDGVADVDADAALPHRLDAAAAAGLVDHHAADRRASFRHPLVRSAVVGAAASEHVQAAHLLLARVRAGDPLRRAYHLAAATNEPDEDVAHEVQQGAEYALHRGGAALAAQLLVRAAALSEDPDRRERRLADAAFVATHAGLLDQAAMLVGRLDRLNGDLVAPSTLLTDGTLQLYRHGAVGPTHRMVVEMLRRRGHDLDDETLARLVGLLLPLCMYSADLDLWQQSEPVVDEFAERLGPVTLLVRDVGGDLLRNADGARDRVTDAFAWPGSTTFDVTLLALCAYFVDSLGEHRSLVDRMVEREVEAGSLTDVMTLLHLTLLDETVRGRWDDAARTFARGLELSTRLGNEMFSHLYRAFYARVLAQRGDVVRARELGLAVDLWARPRGLGVMVQHVEAAALAGSLAAGEYDAAWTFALGLTSPGSFRPYVHESFRCVLDVVEAGMASGHVDEARRHAEAAVAHHVNDVSPRMDMLCTAALALTDGTDDAGRLFVAATQHVAASSFPFDLARISLAHGRWLRRRKDLRGARIALQRAVDLFDSLGSPPWSERACHELSLTRASGEEQLDLSTLLTAQELRIAELAASGLTNKQIGAALYLSPRTVATHLYRTFPKLGITSRAALRDALLAPPAEVRRTS